MDVVDLGPPFHTGFVVDDLHAAMAAWARLGVGWAEPVRSSGCWRAGNDVRTVSMGVVYSMRTDHHLELIAPDDPTFFRFGSLPAAHHVGYYVDDVPQMSVRLRDAGFPIVLSRHTDAADLTPTLTYHRVPGLGFHVELVPVSLRTAIEQWTTTGQFPHGERPWITALE
jgi:Glyoxalase/Bleomycin resistance protein/Dioxygenase superfamily